MPDAGETRFGSAGPINGKPGHSMLPEFALPRVCFLMAAVWALCDSLFASLIDWRFFGGQRNFQPRVNAKQVSALWEKLQVSACYAIGRGKLLVEWRMS